MCEGVSYIGQDGVSEGIKQYLTDQGFCQNLIEFILVSYSSPADLSLESQILSSISITIQACAKDLFKKSYMKPGF